jgi:hypothetical protein
MLKKPSTPPADVAHDPQRLALWQQQQEQSRAFEDQGQTVFEVRGCNYEELDRCSRMKSGSSFCMSMDYPPGVDRWPLVP